MGHCDYNLDIDSYPFFHQDSWEYWKWINTIIEKIEKKEKRIQLINSPYLNIENEDFFSAMIDYIKTKKKKICGQITLSTRQSELCSSTKNVSKNFTEYLENKNKISVDKKLALQLVNEFEANNKLKGLSKCKHKLISLQEYLAAKRILNDNRMINEICFVGGCFPFQHNVVFEDLFHQKLRRKFENNLSSKLNINIIRYERFSNVLDKIKKLVDSKKVDLIVFHVRPEPYLRLIKLLNKYMDNNGNIRWALNMPSFNILYPEKYDLLDLRRVFNKNLKQRNSVIYKFLISCNYIFGSMIGNKHYALKIYYRIVKEVIDFCNSNSIKYIILGPNLRNNNYLEPSLCRDLDLYIKKRITKQKYICGYENYKITKMNQKNGIHVTQYYHDLIAKKLYNNIVDNKLLSPICGKKYFAENTIFEQKSI